jgi:hypothetical protein
MRMAALVAVVVFGSGANSQIPPDYNLTEALRCVLLSSAAYCDSAVSG